MKNLVFGLVAVVLFASLSYGQESEVIYSNCSLRTGDKIGIVDRDGSYKITIDRANLLEDFKIIARESGLSLTYDNVEILHANADHKLNYFGLYAQTRDGSATAIGLTLVNGDFVISNKGATISCVSTGCTGFGCTAYDNGTYWTCSSCTKPCTKTTTVVIKASLSSE